MSTPLDLPEASKSKRPYSAPKLLSEPADTGTNGKLFYHIEETPGDTIDETGFAS